MTFTASWSFWIATRWADSDIHIRFFILSLTLPLQTALIILGNIMPGVVAVMMAYIDDPVELRELIRQLRLPKCSWRLYVFAIFTPIGISLLMLVMQKNFDISVLARLQLANFLRPFLVNLLLGPLWEEVGWRGYLLPMLLRRMGLGRASLFLGLIWGSWHFVLYTVVFGTSIYSFVISFLTIVGFSVILATLYSISGNSLVLPVLFHLSSNSAVVWVVGVERSTLYSIFVMGAATWIVAAILWFASRPEGRLKTQA